MFSRPLAFLLLALGCVTAAAGGAYVATRQNAAATPPAAQAEAEGGVETLSASPRAVAESGPGWGTKTAAR